MRIPTLEWQFYRTLGYRLPLAPEDQKRWYAINRGFQGEQVIDQLVETFPSLAPYWLPNVWLSPRGPQIDGLLITSHTAYLIEIKNYRHQFYYHPERSLLQGKPFATNVLSQLYYEADRLRAYLADYHLTSIKVVPRIVFSDDNLQFNTDTAQWRSHFMTRVEFQHFLEEQAFQIQHDSHRERCLACLASLSNAATIAPRTLSPQENRRLASGPLCPQCHSHHIQYRHRDALCLDCQQCTRRHHLYLATIHEYAVLHPELPLKRQALLTFLGPSISPWTLSRLLTQHFTAQPANRYTTYVNPQCLLDYQ